MPATLVPIDRSKYRDEDDPKATEKRLREKYHEAWRCNPNADFSGADYVYIEFLEKRVQRLEKALRQLLAGPLTTSQRLELLLAAYGVQGTVQRDAELLRANERTLVERYRAADAAGKRAVFALLKTIAADKATTGVGGTR